jgi:hypothetical protein
MDLTAVKERWGKIPDTLQKEADLIWEHLQTQKDSVYMAKATSNFGIDEENTLLTGQKVHCGLIVGVKPEYEVSEKDTWIHPNLNQCRALFDGGEYGNNVNNLADTNCSAGVYAVQSVNSIGDLELKPHTIVDMHMEEAPSIRRSWNGKTIESVYSTALRDRTLSEVQETASKMGAQTKMRSDFTNTLYRGRGSFYFYNNAYKEAGLVLVSPLTGYKVVDLKDHAADYLSNDMVNVSALDRKQQASLYSKAWWNACDLVNTFVMRKSYQSVVADYRTQKASFSTTPIVMKLTPARILELTPKVDLIPEERAQLLHKHLQNNDLEIPVTLDVMNRLMDLRDTHAILNPKYYKDGQLILPRSIVRLL